jgi:hypothetical protein
MGDVYGGVLGQIVFFMMCTKHDEAHITLLGVYEIYSFGEKNSIFPTLAMKQGSPSLI